MLWVDAPFIIVADLLTIDAEVSSIADAEEFSITTSIQRGIEDSANYLRRHLNLGQLSQQDLSLRDVVQPITGFDVTRAYASLAQIVVTGLTEDSWSMMKKFVAARCLLSVYRNAINKKANDRYQSRWDNTESDIRSSYWPNLKRDGIPLVINPLPCPGAVLERAGTFAASNVSIVAGAGTATASVDVSITWTSALYVSPLAPGNGESHPSARVTLGAYAPGSLIRINTTGLTAPNGQQPLWTNANSRYAPGIANGWNIYIGAPGGILYLQNPTPVPLGTTVWTLPSDPVLSGYAAGLGQYEQEKLRVENRLVRS